MLTIHFELGAVQSLKDKRSQLRHMENRLSRQFNISIAETGLQDSHTNALITLGIVNNNPAFIQAEFSRIISWIETHHADLVMIDEKLEII
ncbi:MAG: DUF503 domain-containing protein [Anaerolinea sp.]|nr:DUF503 domain-containing protein [Anaerolinea sp.]